MLSHSSLIHLGGLGRDLVWFWLPPTCASQMPERPLGDSDAVMQELLVVMTACCLEKAFTNSFCASDISLWKQTKMVVSTAQTHDRCGGIKLFSESDFWGMCQCSESWHHSQIISVWSVLRGEASVTHSERSKTSEMCICFTVSGNWFYVELCYKIRFGFCPSEVT